MAADVVAVLSDELVARCASQGERIRELEACIRHMVQVPACMRVCSGRIANPERQVYQKACEYAERELKRHAVMHDVSLDGVHGVI